jgi:hypothetical protein
MKIRPEELSANGYVLLDSLGHKELVPFIRKFIKIRTKYSLIYYLSNLIVFGFAIYYFFRNGYLPGLSLGERFTHFAYGLAIAFTFVPLHEYIHVLAYRSQGAVKTSLDANLRKLYFMALADQFVASRKEFEIIALAPFLTITSILVILFFMVRPDWSLTIIGALLAHTGMCSGDFGLLSYFEYNKDKEIVTYDDTGKGVSFFYARANKIKPVM